MKNRILVYIAVLWAMQCLIVQTVGAQSVEYSEDIAKEAAALEKEGWRPLDASSSIAEQLYNTRAKKYETDSVTGSRRYVISTTEVEGPSFYIAQELAKTYCQQDIAGQISSWVLSEAVQQMEIRDSYAALALTVKRTVLVARQLHRFYATQELVRNIGDRCVVRVSLAYETGPMLDQLREEAVNELRNAMEGWSHEYEAVLFDIFKDAESYNREGSEQQPDEESRQKAGRLAQEGWHSLDVPIADQLYDTKCKRQAVAPNTNDLLYVMATTEVSDTSFILAQLKADEQCKSEIAKQISTWVVSEAAAQLKDKGASPEMQNALLSFFKSTSMVAQQIRRLYRTLQIYKRNGSTCTLQMTVAYELAPLIDQFRDAAISELRNLDGWSVEYEDLMHSVFSGAKSYNRK